MLNQAKNATAAATYDALSKVPEADFIVPLSVTASVAGIPSIYEVQDATVVGRAVRLKTDDEL